MVFLFCISSTISMLDGKRPIFVSFPIDGVFESSSLKKNHKTFRERGTPAEKWMMMDACMTDAVNFFEIQNRSNSDATKAALTLTLRLH